MKPISPRQPEAAMPQIAVIVPNHNDSRYLPRCIRSMLEQEDPPDELILVDDRSTDESVAVIRSLIAGRREARLIENPVNLGTYGAVDAGMKAVRSEYVLFLSANDFVLPGIFARARSCLARHPGAGLWSAMGWLVNEDDRLIRLHSSPVIALGDAYFSPEQCLLLAHRHGNWFTGPTLIYHRETLEAAGRFDPAYMGLSDLLTALIVAGRRGAAYSPAPLGAFRIHRGSYLSRTLADSANVEAILLRLGKRGPLLAPRLFTGEFLARTALRFRFALVRVCKGANIAHVAEKHAGLRGFALDQIDRIVPRTLHRTRVALTFFVLRPFDILPTLWNRGLGALAVLLWLRFQGRAISAKRPDSTTAGKKP